MQKVGSNSVMHPAYLTILANQHTAIPQPNSAKFSGIGVRRLLFFKMGLQGYILLQLYHRGLLSHIEPYIAFVGAHVDAKGM